MASTEINDFLCDPLVTWFISCLEDPNALTNYDDLVDGVLLHNVFLQIEPEPVHDRVIPTGGDSRVRVKNLEIILDNIKQFYEEQLGHILLTIPDTFKLGRDPERHVPEAKLLLLLLLGCAVQCSNKENFITKITTLNLDTQLAMVDFIKQITDSQDIVVTRESMENVNMGNVFAKVKKLLYDKNAYCINLRNKHSTNSNGESITNCMGSDSSIDRHEEDLLLELVQEVSGSERGNISSQKINVMTGSSKISKHERLFNLSGDSNQESNTSREEVHRYAVELADWKSKVRKQRQELEEKTEALIECKEELEHNKGALVKLREEYQELLLEARTAKSYRDELDAVNEKAERVDRLEAEVARYREKLTDIEYYKRRIEELRDDNQVLIDTKDMLEEQLHSLRKRSEKVSELKSEILKFNQLLNDVALERVADKDKYQEVCEENNRLIHLIKSLTREKASGALSSLTRASSASDSEADLADGSGTSADNRLSEQLSNNAQAQVLKLELENRRLTSIIDSLKEESFHENSSRMLELEKEKKKLSLKVDSLSDNTERLGQENENLELVCKQTLEENKKLQTCLTNQRNNLDKQQQEIQTLQGKLTELERSYETMIAKERQRLQALLESAEKRAEDAERSAAGKDREVNELKLQSEMTSREVKEKQVAFEAKLTTLEKDRETAHREVQKLRELVETKDVALDKTTNTIEILEKRVAHFQQEIDNSAAQILRLRKIERSSKELDSRAAIDREALESLQLNLVAEKLNVQQVHATLEKLGLEAEVVHSLPSEEILDRISKMPEVVCRVVQQLETSTEIAKVSTATAVSLTLKPEDQENLQAKLLSLQTNSESLLSEKAKLQVHVTRLESQSASLTSQQAALQLENSRLEASVDELANERSALERKHAELSRDQKRLQLLHEQLNTEYERLLREKETLKTNLRDSKIEARSLRESKDCFETKCLQLQEKCDNLVAHAKSLSNLRGEHSKLKEDFRNLYTNTESLKSQYRSLQEDYRKNKVENNRLSLRQTEMQGEVSAKDERMASLELQVGKLNQQCEILLQMNTGLDSDRRSLMDHISLLLCQYHELLSHALEDKEHYHTEEKIYTDKLNHLRRQKEQLEQKIMEHYKKVDNYSTKKKSLGASLVRRVRKAGSGLFNRTNRRSSWSANATLLSDDNSIKPSFMGHEKAYDDEDVDEDEDNVEVELDEETTQHRESHSSDEGSHVLDSQLETDALRPNDPLSLAHPGTRRTVYYTDDASPSLTRSSTQEKPADTDESSLFQQQQQQQQRHQNRNNENDLTRPHLIFNKISAVINDSTTTTASTTGNKNFDESKNIEKDLVDVTNDKDRKTANSVWFEYGCV